MIGHPLRVVTLPLPAGGLNFVYVQPAGIVSRLRCILMDLLDDDPTAGLRIPAVSLYEPGGLRMSAFAFQTSTMDTGDAELLIAMDGYPRPEFYRVFFGDSGYVRESSLRIVLPLWEIRSEIQGIQPLDHFSSLQLLFEDINLFAPGAVA